MKGNFHNRGTLRLRVHQSVFFPRLAYFFHCSKWERRAFKNARSVFFELSIRAFFFSVTRFEECSTLDKMLRSSLLLSSQPTNQSGGGAGLPTVLRLNNGEVNNACLRVFIFFTRSNYWTTIILLWKIMLGETFHSWRICHVSNHINHSISKKENAMLWKRYIWMYSKHFPIHKLQKHVFLDMQMLREHSILEFCRHYCKFTFECSLKKW